MRLAALVLFLAACASRDRDATAAAAGRLSPELLPAQSPAARFVDLKDAAPRTLRVGVSPEDGTLRLVLETEGQAPREIRVTRTDGSLLFAAGGETGTELLRVGAAPGDAWESAGRRVRFEGWERVIAASDPSVGWEAARVSARRGPPGMEQVETWWFARGVGVVRLRSDHGGVFVDELIRAGR
jgi:hypothetical protein